jgi:hypothetical protein
MNEPEEMREIHEIRLMIYEETKDMTPKQRIDRTNAIAAEVAKQYGLKFPYAAITDQNNKPLVNA